MGDEERKPVEIDETRSLSTDGEGKAVEGDEPATEGEPEEKPADEAEPATED